MWKDYVRKEELVSIAMYDGSKASMEKLCNENRDIFEIRVSDKGKESLVIRDDNVYIRVEPNSCIVEDSCGRLYSYEPAFLDFMFRPIEEDDLRAEFIAESLYESFIGCDDTLPSDWELLSESEKAPYITQAEYLLDNFFIARR